MSSTFWDLCSDIIIELCTYFSIDELYYSFYPDTLPYLFELLTESHLPLHLCLTKDDLLTSMILSLVNTNQIISLHTSTCHIPLNSFNSVKTLTLNNVSELFSSISTPSVLPLLEHLIFTYSNGHNSQAEKALKLAFSHRKLRYLKLHLSNHYSLMVNRSLGQSLSIEKLIINASCSPSTLNFLLKSLPCLRILRLRTLMNLEPEINTNRFGGNHVVAPPFSLVHHTSLEILDLVWYHPTILNISYLLTKFIHLKQCRFSGVMNSSELDGKIWYQLLEEKFPNLLQMNVNMLIWTGINTEEVKQKFDLEIFFKKIHFQLIPSDQESELLIFTGDYQRSI